MQLADQTPTLEHDAWCHEHHDETWGCASEPVVVAGVSTWVKRVAGRVVAVVGDEDVAEADLAALGERVTVLRGLVGAA